jgi:hypothetical protein
MVDRGTLKGIAATLLVLALLAERAAGRSLPVRFVVLAILGRAETIARAFVAREMAALIAEAVEAGCVFPDTLGPDVPCADLLAPGETSAPHHGAAEAQLLALRLRMLAALLGMLAGEDSVSGDRPDGRAAFGVADDLAGGAARAAGLKDLPLLLVVRLPAARFPLRPHDTS